MRRVLALLCAVAVALGKKHSSDDKYNSAVSSCSKNFRLQKGAAAWEDFGKLECKKARMLQSIEVERTNPDKPCADPSARLVGACNEVAGFDEDTCEMGKAVSKHVKEMNDLGGLQWKCSGMSAFRSVRWGHKNGKVDAVYDCCKLDAGYFVSQYIMESECVYVQSYDSSEQSYDERVHQGGMEGLYDGVDCEEGGLLVETTIIPCNLKAVKGDDGVSMVPMGLAMEFRCAYPSGVCAPHAADDKTVVGLHGLGGSCSSQEGLQGVGFEVGPHASPDVSYECGRFTGKCSKASVKSCRGDTTDVIAAYCSSDAGSILTRAGLGSLADPRAVVTCRPGEVLSSWRKQNNPANPVDYTFEYTCCLLDKENPAPVTEHETHCVELDDKPLSELTNLSFQCTGNSLLNSFKMVPCYGSGVWANADVVAGFYRYKYLCQPTK